MLAEVRPALRGSGEECDRARGPSAVRGVVAACQHRVGGGGAQSWAG